MVRKRQKLFLDALTRVGTLWAACQATKIGRRTVYDWRDKDKAFRKEFEESRLICVERVETGLFRDALRGDNVARKVYLSAESPQKYSEKKEFEHRGKLTLAEWLDQEDEDGGTGDGTNSPSVPSEDS